VPGAIYVSALYSRGVLQAFADGPEAVGPRLSDRERPDAAADCREQVDQTGGRGDGDLGADCRVASGESDGASSASTTPRDSCAYAIRQGVIVA